MKLITFQNERGFWQWIIKHPRGEYKSFREYSSKAIAVRDGKKTLKKYKQLDD